MIYLVVGVYYLFLFARRSKEKENLIFGIFTIMLVLYQIMRNQLRNEFNFDFVMIKKCEYIVIATIVPVFTHFIRELFKFKWNMFQKVCDGFLGLIFLYELFVTNIAHYNVINKTIIQPIWIIYMIFIFYFLIVRMREKNKDAIFIFSGVLVMFAAVIVDILSTRGVFVFPKIMGYAFFFFISSNIKSRSSISDILEFLFKNFKNGQILTSRNKSNRIKIIALLHSESSQTIVEYLSEEIKWNPVVTQ